MCDRVAIIEATVAQCETDTQNDFQRLLCSWQCGTAIGNEVRAPFVCSLLDGELVRPLEPAWR